MYDVKDFYESFRRKSPIYYEVYQYLRTQKLEADEACLGLRKALFDGSLKLESHYACVCKQSKVRMDVAVTWWEKLRNALLEHDPQDSVEQADWEQAKLSIVGIHKYMDSMLPEERLHVSVQLHETVALLKYIYLDLQWPLLLNNAVLNKVFFEEYIMEKLDEFSEETGADTLELLTFLDCSTKNRYIVESDMDDALHWSKVRSLLGDMVGEFIELADKFSQQKQSERLFNQTFEKWSPLVIDIRDTIGCYLETFGICKRQNLDCMPIYQLLPLLEDDYLPQIYLR